MSTAPIKIIPQSFPGPDVQVPTADGSMATVSTSLDGNNTAFAGTQQNIAATYATVVNNFNSELQRVADIMGTGYNAQMANGAIHPPALPNFPHSYVYIPGGPNGEASYAQTGPQIMPSFPLATLNAAAPQAPLIPNMIDIGAELADDPGWFSVGPHDTWPLNKETPRQPDGHKYLRVPAGVGSHKVTLADGTEMYVGGWYEQVG